MTGSQSQYRPKRSSGCAARQHNGDYGTEPQASLNDGLGLRGDLSEDNLMIFILCLFPRALPETYAARNTEGQREPCIYI